MPQLVRDYRVEVLAAGSSQWSTAVDVQGNRHRHRVHALPADLPSFTAARLVIDDSNGSAEARVVAFRVQS
jgi:hypothetical protein